ncbi:MAG: hypothetical protein HY243_01230 [Proteobacteria bacterium]|nr:hypothetical protein [Pseudomonadota bacterium]
MRLAFLSLASYGLLYFSYKWYALPDPDFLVAYSQMYRHPLDFTVADPSHVLRQGSAVLTYLFYEIGVYYPAQISFHDSHIDQRLYFAALLANYVALLIAAAIAGEIAQAKTGGLAYSLIAGLLCLLSFHAQNFVVTGLTEGVTWLFMALIFLLLLYVCIREFSFAGIDPQLSPASLFSNVASWRIDTAFLTQGLLAQNVVILCLVVNACLWLQAKPRVEYLGVYVTALAALAAIAMVEGEQPGDAGRVMGMLTPMFAVMTATGLWEFERKSVPIAATIH